MLGRSQPRFAVAGDWPLSLQPRCRPECREVPSRVGDASPGRADPPARRRRELGRRFLRPGFAHDSRAQGTLVSFRRLRLALGPRSPASLDRAALAKGDDPMASQNRSGDAVVRGLTTSAAGDPSVMNRRVILAAGFLVLFIGGGARFAIGLTLKPIAEELGVGRATLRAGGRRLFSMVTSRQHVRLPVGSRTRLACVWCSAPVSSSARRGHGAPVRAVGALAGFRVFRRHLRVGKRYRLDNASVGHG